MNSKDYEIHSPGSREAILESIITKLKEDQRIVGAILVGSGAYDFKDKYSDIDLAVVTMEEENLEEIYYDWIEVMQNAFQIIHRFEFVVTPKILLHGFFLENFIEIDISFQPINAISAHKKNWLIIFDITGKLKEIMQESWKQEEKKNYLKRFTDQVDGSWYYVNQALIALARGNYWKALYQIETIRNEIVNIVSLPAKLSVKHYNNIEKLPQTLLKELESLLNLSLNKENLFSAVKKATEIYFREIAKTSKQINGPDYSFLEKKIYDLIEYFKQELF